jgi:hypothetical protein
MLDVHSPEYKQLVAELRAADSEQIQSAIANSLSYGEYAASLARRRVDEDVALDAEHAGPGTESASSETDDSAAQDAVVHETARCAVSSRPLAAVVTERSPGMICEPARYASISYENLQRSMIELNTRRHIADAAVWDLYAAYTNVAARDAVAYLSLAYLKTPDEQTLREANAFLNMRAILLCTVLANARRCYKRESNEQLDAQQLRSADANADADEPSLDDEMARQTAAVQGCASPAQKKLLFRTLSLICTGHCDARAERFEVPAPAAAPPRSVQQQPLEHVTSDAGEDAPRAPQVRTRTEWNKFCAARRIAPQYSTSECAFCGRSFVFDKRHERATQRMRGGPLPGDAWPSLLHIVARDHEAHPPLSCAPACSSCVSGVLAYEGLFYAPERVRRDLVARARAWAKSPHTKSNKRAALVLMHTNEFMEELQAQLREQMGTIRLLYAAYTTRAVNVGALRSVRTVMEPPQAVRPCEWRAMTTVRIERSALRDQQQDACRRDDLMHVELGALRVDGVAGPADAGSDDAASQYGGAGTTARMPLITETHDDTPQLLQALNAAVCELKSEHQLGRQKKPLPVRDILACSNQLDGALYALHRISNRIAGLICARGAKRSRALDDDDADSLHAKRQRTHLQQPDAEPSPIVIM